MRTLLLLVAVVALLAAAHGAQVPKLPNQISGLPGLNFPINFTMYSGYITVNAAEGRNLFYWFVTSQRSPSTDPLVAWFNGGPGCSSLLGFFTENGPFSVNPDAATLSANPYAWNLISNVVYIESPVGVGFSYTTQKNYKNGDNTTMADAYVFLTEFFKLYPSFASNDFYISGESYGGHYVPQLAWTVLNNNKNSSNAPINLKGILVGNPWTDDNIDSASVPVFVYTHSLASYSAWLNVQSACYVNGTGDSRRFRVPFTRRFSETRRFLDTIDIRDAACNKAVNLLVNEVGDLINQYDIYTPCVESSTALGCMNYTALIDYLNTQAVRTALGVAPHIGAWTECKDVNYGQSWPSVLPIYPELMANINVTIYSGDVTFNCPALGAGVWLNILGSPGGVVRDWRAWTIPSPLGPQVGGYVKKWAGITQVTVRDAGHMVPQFQPYPAFVMFQAYMNGEL